VFFEHPSARNAEAKLKGQRHNGRRHHHHTHRHQNGKQQARSMAEEGKKDGEADLENAVLISAA